jgi:hypothetical protein
LFQIEIFGIPEVNKITKNKCKLNVKISAGKKTMRAG